MSGIAALDLQAAAICYMQSKDTVVPMETPDAEYGGAMSSEGDYVGLMDGRFQSLFDGCHEWIYSTAYRPATTDIQIMELMPINWTGTTCVHSDYTWKDFRKALHKT